MNLAAIDIGTNSVRLLISGYSKGRFNTLLRTMHITRIGENLSKNNFISPPAARRTLDTLKEYKELICRHEVGKYRAVGTSALRKAENSKWFVDYAFRKTGINIEIISGEQEANLSFMGATTGLGRGKVMENAWHKKHKLLVVDIGGGSTQLRAGSCGRPQQVTSLDLGCVTLTERLGDNFGQMEKYLKDYLTPALQGIGQSDLGVLIGLAGTITTLAAIDLKLKKYDRDKIHHHGLDIKNISQIYENLKNMDLKQRKKVRGLEPGRADIIVAGTAILMTILNFLNQGYIIVSENDLLDGIIYSLYDF